VSCEIVPWRRSRLEQLHNDKKLSREERRIKSAAAGMIRPEDTYAVAANCCECRHVPNEKLVNTDGHTFGTPALELVNGVALKLNKKEQLDQVADKVAEACPAPWKTVSTVDN
jgi:hypothetical protein